MLHLNLPAADDNARTKILQKTRWMFLGLLYPELIMCFAYAQMLSAKQSLHDMNNLGLDWSIVHGFYADMGGFALKALDFDLVPMTAKQLHVLINKGIIAAPHVQRREILDKSKANGFVKGLAIWQTAYILITITIRLIRNLAVTPLEIMTGTIGICACVTMVFWWQKPLDVETPTILRSEFKIKEIIDLIGAGTMKTWSDTPLDFAESDIYLSHKWGRGCTEWIISLGLQSRPMKRKCVSQWQTVRLTSFAGIPNDRDFKPKSLLHNQALGIPVVLSGALNIYSGYAFTFPSPIEQKAWIVLSITSITTLLIYGVSEVIGFNLSDYNLHSMEILWEYKKRRGWCWLFHILAIVTLTTRLALLGLSLATLRSLPKSCFLELGYFQLFNFLA